MQDTTLQNVKRLYAAVKTGFDSTMEPDTDTTRIPRVPVSIGDHLGAIDAMFAQADKAGVECWVPPQCSQWADRFI